MTIPVREFPLGVRKPKEGSSKEIFRENPRTVRQNIQNLLLKIILFVQPSRKLKKSIFNKISKFLNDIFGAILVHFYAKYFESLKNISLRQHNLRAQS